MTHQHEKHQFEQSWCLLDTVVMESLHFHSVIQHGLHEDPCELCFGQFPGKIFSLSVLSEKEKMHALNVSVVA